MGIYNDYYKKYYMDVKGSGNPKEYKSVNQYKQVATSSVNSSQDKRQHFPIFLNVFSSSFATIFVFQTAVVIVLFLIVIGSKLYPASIASDICTKAYSYIDTGIFEKDFLKNEDVLAAFDEMKTFFNIDGREESFIMKNYALPVDINNVSQIKVAQDKLLLNFKNEAFVRSSYMGTVKEVQREDSISILIDYGNGIEMKYIGLEESLINEGDKVDKGSILGSILNTSTSTTTIEIYYMGSRLNPSKCFNLQEI